MNNNITKVLITVDTEHSIGGAFQNPELKPVGNEKRIYGKFENRFYGIPLIMDIADQYGLKIIFFVEVLNKYFFGEEETHEICEYIFKRGHEVQLHLHPNYLNFKEPEPQALKYKDNLFHYNLAEQIRLIGEGRALLQKYGIKNPLAFRAGNYGFSRTTLTALKQNGFMYESSYNLRFLRPEQGFDGVVINDAQMIDGIIEFPITNFIEHLPFIRKRSKPLDINGISSREMLKVLDWAQDTGSVNYITIILHSFSFIEPIDAQYSKMTPRQYVIDRFKTLCRFLSENKEKFSVTGFNDIAGHIAGNENKSPVFFQMPAETSLVRLGEQAYHNFIK